MFLAWQFRITFAANLVIKQGIGCTLHDISHLLSETSHFFPSHFLEDTQDYLVLSHCRIGTGNNLKKPICLSLDWVWSCITSLYISYSSAQKSRMDDGTVLTAAINQFTKDHPLRVRISFFLCRMSLPFLPLWQVNFSQQARHISCFFSSASHGLSGF